MSVVSPGLRQGCSCEGELSRLGHDLRAPLNTVLGMAEMLAGGALSAGQRKQVEMVQRAGNRLLVLVNELLDRAVAPGSEPVRRGALPDSPQSPPASARSLTGVRVLVVDVSEECRVVVETYLAATGAQVTLGETGEAALAAIARQDFDIVFMDMRLPDRSGLDVVRAIRRAERARGAAPVPVVALSADVDPSAVFSALAAGCSAHLAKPVARQALLGAIFATRERAGVARTPTPALKAKFLSNRGVEIFAARAALRRRDFEPLATLGHNLHGSGASYGFPGLSRLGQRIEAAASAMDAGGVAKLLTELASAVSDATSVAPLPRAKALSRTPIKAARPPAGGSHRGR